jgi:DNA-binding transcriptional LysR family regulator
MINPHQIISFVEVAHRSSMVLAARHLKITSAAVSKHMQQLENQLGVQLLKRSTRKIELTPEGLIYLQHARRILDAYQQSTAALSHCKEEPTGTLRIACGPQFGYLHLIPHLKEFHQRFPKLQLQIISTQTMPDIEADKIDIVLGLTAAIPINCMRRALIHARWIICAAPDYLEMMGTPKKPSDLSKHQIITHSGREPNNVITFKNGKSIAFEPTISFDDTRAMRRAALNGAGIVMLHDYIVADDIRENRLIEILDSYMEKERTVPIYVAYPQASQVHLNTRKFVDFMVEKTVKKP